MATDSRLIGGVQGGPRSVMSETQQKIVPLTKYVAALTIDPYFEVNRALVNIRSTLEQIRPDFHHEGSVDEVLKQLPGRFSGQANLPLESFENMPLRVVGYSKRDRAVNVFQLRGLQVDRKTHSTFQPGVDWFGFTDIATRLVHGNTNLAKEFGIDPGQPIEYRIPTLVMSINDAIDLAEMLVHTTATFGKFVQAFGPPGEEARPVPIEVGGPVQSAVITPAGFSWVRTPNWAIPPSLPSSVAGVSEDLSDFPEELRNDLFEDLAKELEASGSGNSGTDKFDGSDKSDSSGETAINPSSPPEDNKPDGDSPDETETKDD